jgi:opacity protein-like surface antigen
MKSKILIAAMLALLSSSVMAQTKDRSVSVFGNYSKSSGVDGGNGSLYGSYGFLPTQSLELDVFVGVFFTSGADSDTTTLAGVAAKYYFGSLGRAGALVPYLKADVATMHGGEFNQTIYGAGAGIDYALTESASVYLEILAHKSTKSEVSGTMTDLNLGLTYRF